MNPERASSSSHGPHNEANNPVVAQDPEGLEAAIAQPIALELAPAAAMSSAPGAGEGPSEKRVKKRGRPNQKLVEVKTDLTSWLCNRVLSLSRDHMERKLGREDLWTEFLATIVDEAKHLGTDKIRAAKPDMSDSKIHEWVHGNIDRVLGNMKAELADSHRSPRYRESLKDSAEIWTELWNARKARKDAPPPHIMKRALAAQMRAKRQGETQREWEERKLADAKTQWIAWVDNSNLVNKTAIGGGSYGRVFKCQILGSSFLRDQPYVVKYMRVDDGTLKADDRARHLDNCMRELSMQVKHGALIRCIGTTSGGEGGIRRNGLIQPYWNYGSVADLLLRHGDNAFAEHTRRRMGAKVPRPEVDTQKLERRLRMELLVAENLGSLVATFLSGLIKLHEEGLVHMDLHAGNVLLHVDETETKVYIGICDWGECRHIGESVMVKMPAFRKLPDGAHKQRIERERLARPWIHQELFWGGDEKGFTKAQTDFDAYGVVYILWFLAEWGLRVAKRTDIEDVVIRQTISTFSNFLHMRMQFPKTEPDKHRLDLAKFLDMLQRLHNCSATKCQRNYVEMDTIPQLDRDED